MSAEFLSFLQSVFGRKPFVLLVTAEWCGHCRVFKPEINKAVKSLKQKKSTKQRGGAILVDMSDEVASHLMNTHQNHLLGSLLQNNVTGFPAMLAVNKINDSTNTMALTHFNGQRNARSVEDFLVNTAKMG